MKPASPQKPAGLRPTATRLTLLSFALFYFISGAFFVREGSAQNPAESVVWMSLIDASVKGTIIKKTAGCNGCPAGGTSQQQLGSGDGYVTFKVAAATHVLYAGLSNGNTDASPGEIDFAISLNGAGTAEVRENGVLKASTSYNGREVFKVAVESGQIVYRKDWLTIYTSSAPVSYPLLVDTSLLSSLASISTATLSGARLLNIKTSTATYLEPPLPALPAAGGKFVDPVFGTEIMRVTDASDCSSYCQVAYSYWPTINANNTRLLVLATNGGNNYSTLFYSFNPTTFTLGAKTVYAGNPTMDFASGSYWHPTNPDVIYAFSSMDTKLYQYNVTGGQSVVKDFASDIGAGKYVAQPSMSDDATVIGFTVKNVSDFSAHGYMIYNLATGAVVLYEADAFTNEVHISKGGDYATVDLDPDGVDNDPPQRVKRWTLTGTPSSLTLLYTDEGMSHNTTKYGYAAGFTAHSTATLSRWSYADLTRTTLFPLSYSHNGAAHISGLANADAWVLVSLADRRPATVSTGYDASATSILLTAGHGARTPSVGLPNQVVWWNETDYPRGPGSDPNAEIVQITAISTDTLTVVRGQGGTAAVAHNTPGKTYRMMAVGPYHGELVLFKTDGSGALKRLLHHRGEAFDYPNGSVEYYDSQFGNISRDGQWVAFSSNWGSSGRRDVFVARLPPLL